MNAATLYNIAKMYYQDNMGQQEIANVVGVSRPMISKMLKEAKETGIVEITLHAPLRYENEEIQKVLIEKLNISEINIVNAEEIQEANMEQRLEAFTTFAANYIMEYCKSFKRIGIGWGMSIYRTVLKMPYSKESNNMCFLPLVGGAGDSDPCYQTNSIVDRIAEKFKCDKYFFNAPAFIYNSLVRQYMEDKYGLGNHSDFWNNIDAAIFSVGGLFHESDRIQNAISDAKTIDFLNTQDVIGDLLGNFINRDGAEVISKEDAITVSIPWDFFYRIPNRLCLAIGKEKAEFLIMAANKGLYTSLITDSHTAHEMLNHMEG